MNSGRERSFLFRGLCVCAFTLRTCVPRINKFLEDFHRVTPLRVPGKTSMIVDLNTAFRELRGIHYCHCCEIA